MFLRSVYRPAERGGAILLEARAMWRGNTKFRKGKVQLLSDHSQRNAHNSTQNIAHRTEARSAHLPEERKEQRPSSPRATVLISDERRCSRVSRVLPAPERAALRSRQRSMQRCAARTAVRKGWGPRRTSPTQREPGGTWSGSNLEPTARVPGELAPRQHAHRRAALDQ